MGGGGGGGGGGKNHAREVGKIHSFEDRDFFPRWCGEETKLVSIVWLWSYSLIPPLPSSLSSFHPSTSALPTHSSHDTVHADVSQLKGKGVIRLLHFSNRRSCALSLFSFLSPPLSLPSRLPPLPSPPAPPRNTPSSTRPSLVLPLGPSLFRLPPEGVLEPV